MAAFLVNQSVGTRWFVCYPKSTSTPINVEEGLWWKVWTCKMKSISISDDSWGDELINRELWNCIQLFTCSASFPFHGHLGSGWTEVPQEDFVLPANPVFSEMCLNPTQQTDQVFSSNWWFYSSGEQLLQAAGWVALPQMSCVDTLHRLLTSFKISKLFYAHVFI